MKPTFQAHLPGNMETTSFQRIASLPTYTPVQAPRKRLASPGLAPDAFLARLSYQVRTRGISIASRADLARQRDLCRPGLLLWDYIGEICRKFGWGFHMRAGAVEFYRAGYDPDEE